MTSHKRILNLDQRRAKECRKFAMFIHNCPAHPKIIDDLKNIRHVSSSPNMTSKLQPLDSGFIKNLKRHYRRRIKSFCKQLISNLHYKFAKLYF